MRSELDKYGIQMPTFSKIGGILANELSVDEAACKSVLLQLAVVQRSSSSLSSLCSELTVLPPVHAAVIAINEAVDRGQAALTMGAMNNPNAMLKNLQEALAQDYQDALSQAKSRKMSQSSGRVRSSDNTSGNIFFPCCYHLFSVSVLKYWARSKGCWHLFYWINAFFFLITKNLMDTDTHISKQNCSFQSKCLILVFGSDNYLKLIVALPVLSYSAGLPAHSSGCSVSFTSPRTDPPHRPPPFLTII